MKKKKAKAKTTKGRKIKDLSAKKKSSKVRAGAVGNTVGGALRGNTIGAALRDN